MANSRQLLWICVVFVLLLCGKLKIFKSKQIYLYFLAYGVNKGTIVTSYRGCS